LEVLAAFPDFSLRRLARTPSTQDVVRRAAVDGAPEGFCCIADEQTLGRGRQGRTWSAPAGTALLASVLLRRPPSSVPGLPFAAGLALLEALLTISGIEARRKWPNDVLVGGRKLAGILCEVEPAAASGGEVAVAVGVGVNLRVGTFPPGADGISAHEVAAPPDPLELLHAWLVALTPRLLALGRAGIPGLRDEWRAKAAGLGDELLASGRSFEIRGVAEGIADDGALMIRTHTGVVRVLAADVHIASAAG